MKRAQRLDPIVRKDLILNAAIKLSIKKGCYRAISRDAVAAAAQVSKRVVTKYFGSMGQLKNLILQTAIDGEIYPIILQGILLRDPVLKRADKTTIAKAIATLKSKQPFTKLK